MSKLVAEGVLEEAIVAECEHIALDEINIEKERNRIEQEK